MKKLQLKKDVIQNLDMQKLRGGGDTDVPTIIIGDSGGTNCGTCGVCPTKRVTCFSCQKSCVGNTCDTLTDPITDNSISGKSQCNNICYISNGC